MATFVVFLFEAILERTASEDINGIILLPLRFFPVTFRMTILPFTSTLLHSSFIHLHPFSSIYPSYEYPHPTLSIFISTTLHYLFFF